MVPGLINTKSSIQRLENSVNAKLFRLLIYWYPNQLVPAILVELQLPIVSAMLSIILNLLLFIVQRNDCTNDVVLYYNGSLYFDFVFIFFCIAVILLLLYVRPVYNFSVCLFLSFCYGSCN